MGAKKPITYKEFYDKYYLVHSKISFDAYKSYLTQNEDKLDFGGYTLNGFFEEEIKGFK